ncbi:Amino-acid acetyltransferase, mitochondrial [Puccinia graminis f. sp. tritici]|uniref:Amino-acid acetyltransferase, mitochondrial n=1 Tax=Puccinia graminis f. sp. tritici TaxID=56615 RepID=A0A5B0NJA8_PUCGR|nr:Amino-acid acetyltransferase, mitochondrial [Puccinia graminis f. sp. tritici]
MNLMTPGLPLPYTMSMMVSRRVPTRRLLNPPLNPNIRSYYLRSSEDDLSSNLKPSADKLQRELILSVLEAHPSARDSRLYLKSFAPTSKKIPKNSPDLNSNSSSNDTFNPGFPTGEAMPTTATLAATTSSSAFVQPNKSNETSIRQTNKNQNRDVAQLILSTPNQHTGLVKIQGPFTDRQLQSIVDGVIYLKTLGLMSIIVLDDEAWHYPSHTSLTASLPHKSKPPTILHTINSSESRRQAIVRETGRLSAMLESRGGQSRPIQEGVLRLTDDRNQDGDGLDLYIDNLDVLKSAIKNQEIPIIPPIAINSSCATICVSADEVVKSLAKGLAAVGKSPNSLNHTIDAVSAYHGQPATVRSPTHQPIDQKNKDRLEEDDNQDNELDLTPLRLMIINREGGIPSPARNGHPHLSINLASEYEFINETFRWGDSHPTSLANLSMAKSCLKYLPNESSAIIVSHRSPKSLIANLITNKPAHSPSLKHSILLNHARDIGLATPTLIRKGLPIKVIRGIDNLDLTKLKDLLEKSFKKTLDHQRYFERLKNSLRFVILAGDYQAAAIVTNEWEEKQESREGSESEDREPIVYLDKFAVLPSLQGEGIVDFLWGALRDESFGLGNLDALNNNGGLSGLGEPVDLVWRSRTDNPVNRWYFERSNGFIKLPPANSHRLPSTSTSSTKPDFSLFWCTADLPSSIDIKHQHSSSTTATNPSVDPSSSPLIGIIRPTKLQTWCRVINQIPSCWAS